MKNTSIKKLTIIIESTNYKNISGEVMKTVAALKKSITPNQGLKLSMSLNDKNDSAKNNNSDYISPANWDYWAV